MKASTSDSPGTLRPLLRLVWPVLVEQVLVMLVGFSDTLLAGHYLLPTHLAAMTVISYVLWMLTNLFSFVSIGAVAMTARFVGGRDFAMANRVVSQSFILGVVIAAVFTAIGLALAGRFMSLLQLEGEPAALATRYLRVLVPMLPLMMLEAVGIGCLRGAGDMVTGLVTMIVVNAVNVTVAWSLLLGLGPLPQLGWDALPISTACGHALGGLIPFCVLLYGRFGLRIEWARLRPDRDLMRRILRIGVPGGIDVLSIVVCQLVFLSIVNSLSTDEVAAHGVATAHRVAGVSAGLCLSTGGRDPGRPVPGGRRPAAARRVVVTACLTSGTLLTVAALVLFFGGGPLVALFLNPDQANVAAIAPELLAIVAFALPPLALLQVLTGALRGAGDTRWPLAFTFIGFLGVRIPLAYVLIHVCGYGIRAAWYALTVDVIIRCVLIVIRFFQGGWKRIEV